MSILGLMQSLTSAHINKAQKINGPGPEQAKRAGRPHPCALVISLLVLDSDHTSRGGSDDGSGISSCYWRDRGHVLFWCPENEAHQWLENRPAEACRPRRHCSRYKCTQSFSSRLFSWYFWGQLAFPALYWRYWEWSLSGGSLGFRGRLSCQFGFLQNWSLKLFLACRSQQSEAAVMSDWILAAVLSFVIVLWA